MCAARERAVGNLHLEHVEPVINLRSSSKGTPGNNQFFGVYILVFSDEKHKIRKSLYKSLSQ
jgi:hypothetical protein